MPVRGPCVLLLGCSHDVGGQTRWDPGPHPYAGTSRPRPSPWHTPRKAVSLRKPKSPAIPPLLAWLRLSFAKWPPSLRFASAVLVRIYRMQSSSASRSHLRLGSGRCAARTLPRSSLQKISVIRGVHRAAPYAMTLTRLGPVLDPGQPFAAHHAHDIRQIARALPAPLGDRHEPEAFGMAKRVLDRPATDSGLGRNLIDA